MNKSYKNIGNFYWRISVTFLFLLMGIGIVYFFITFQALKNYYQEANQKLNIPIAGHIASEIKPFINGKVNHSALENIFHNTMVLNPSVEIYLLDNNGKILSFFAPGKVILKKIDLLPVRKYIATRGQEFIYGEDPRKEGAQKVFSATEVKERGISLGYIYVVLAGEEYDTIFELLMGSFILKVGAMSLLITFISALLIGLFIIWGLTRNLQTIIQSVRKFAMGDMTERIHIKSTSEFLVLANTFNEMADTIVDNMEKLKAMEKLKSELIANISHDLRTPLTIIQGYAETLAIKEDIISVVEKKRYLMTVIKNTEKLGKLVANLFEISKLDSLQVIPLKESFFFFELVSDIISKYQLIASEKNVRIISSFSENSYRVFADISMIDRVLQNLIDNAIKFTPEGGTISVSVKNKGYNSLEIKICDTGSGISETDLPLIFNRFYTSGKNSVTAGSGLGLAIVKKLLELHNSKIEVNSELGSGTIFTFWLAIYDATLQKNLVDDLIVSNENLILQ